MSTTIVIAGASWNAFENASVAGAPTLASATVSTVGATLTIVDTCPDTSSDTSSYTATATTLTLIETQAGGGSFVLSFAKQ